MDNRSSIRSFLTIGMLLLIPIFAGSTFAQYKGTPVTMDKLMSVVQSAGISTAEIITTIRNNGVNFEVTPRNEFQLQKAGVAPEIIEAAKTNYRDSKLRYMLFENGTPGITSILMTWEASTKEKITSEKYLAPGGKERISFPASASNIRLSITRDARTRDADMVMDQHEVELDEMNRCLHLTNDQNIFLPCK